MAGRSRITRALRGLFDLAKELVELLQSNAEDETVDDILGDTLETELEAIKYRLELERRKADTK